MTIPQKRHRISNLSLREISSVDKPAQEGATVVLMKRADDAFSDIRKNAADVAAGATPAYGVEAFEDAMFSRAEALGREQGITMEQALLKHLTQDRELMDLAHASEVARVAAYGAEVSKRYGGATA